MPTELRAEQPIVSFGALLRRLRAEARLTQEELAEASGVSPRSISDLERGVSRAARKDTARLLADALALSGAMRTAFVAAARGRAPVSEVLTAQAGRSSEAPQPVMLWFPHDDLGSALHSGPLGQLIDAMTETVGQSGAIAGIWLIGLTTVVEAETPPNRPGALSSDTAGTTSRGPSSAEQFAGRHLPTLTEHDVQWLAHAAEPAMGEALAAALGDEPLALGAELPA